VTAIALDFIYFDIDGTLCSYGIDPRRALRRVCRGLGIEADLDPYDYYDLYKAVAREMPEGTYSEVSDEAYRRLLERHGYEDSSLARKVADGYRRTRLSSISLYPETLDVLESLSEAYPLGIISNGPSEIQWAKVNMFRLKDYFQTIIISGDVGVEKPSEAIFRLALNRARTPADRCAHVGDSLVDDVNGSRQAGMTSIWVNRGVLDFEGVDVRPHYELRDLRELLHLLGR
jgi:HAD superfamily hydrolase (TIGR01549 family)